MMMEKFGKDLTPHRVKYRTMKRWSYNTLNMNSPKHPISHLILFWSILFGALVRLYPVWVAGFPVNDGGLFYRMVQELVTAGFKIPLNTTYNQLNIPFAYPPLPFYLAGFINQVLQVPLIEVVRWLPPLFSILIIPAVFWFVRILTVNDNIAAWATLFFAFMPRSFEWLIMGGGITRSPATLFFILFAGFLIKVFRDQERKYILHAIISGGLILLSHPERSLHALTTAVFFLAFFVRSKRGIMDAVAIGTGVAILSAPWWAFSLMRFGLEPILQAGKAGGDRALFWAPMLLLNFTDETIAITALLGVIGSMYELARQRWFLPLWLLISFITDPRSAPHVIPLQLSILAGIAIMDVVFPSISLKHNSEDLFNSRTGKLVISYFLIIGLVNGLSSAFILSKIHLSPNERDALEWVSQNVSGQHNFLIYPRESDTALSPLLEWFPALTSQTSLSTYQGREWLTEQFHSDTYFADREKWLICASLDENCLNDWIKTSEEHIEYVLINTNTQNNATSLSISLKTSPNYTLAYANPEIEIFQTTR
jgi:hypothetical protein